MDEKHSKTEKREWLLGESGLGGAGCDFYDRAARKYLSVDQCSKSKSKGAKTV